jgi:hypothetical protein
MKQGAEHVLAVRRSFRMLVAQAGKLRSRSLQSTSDATTMQTTRRADTHEMRMATGLSRNLTETASKDHTASTLGTQPGLDQEGKVPRGRCF